MNNQQIYKIVGLIAVSVIIMTTTVLFFNNENIKLNKKEAKYLKANQSLRKIFYYQKEILRRNTKENHSELIKKYKFQANKYFINLKKANSGEFKKIAVLNNQNKKCLQLLKDECHQFDVLLTDTNKNENYFFNFNQFIKTQTKLIINSKALNNYTIICKLQLIRNNEFSKKVIIIMTLILFLFLLSLILNVQIQYHNQKKHFNSFPMQIGLN